jgi:hypothetical protein
MNRWNTFGSSPSVLHRHGDFAAGATTKTQSKERRKVNYRNQEVCAPEGNRKEPDMSELKELTVLLRASVELPMGTVIKTDAFLEGWNVARSLDLERLEKRMKSRGWQLTKVVDGFQRSGVGHSGQHAIANAVKLGLRAVDAHSNGAKVAQIKLSVYPWFCVAKVVLCPFRIEELSVMCGASLPAIPCEDSPTPSYISGLVPSFINGASSPERPSASPGLLSSRA